jgi:CheY-like chemotaxis protein
VPKTLLAVDDSATMRKVLEITFAGEDFRVLTAESSQKALAHMSEDPVAVVIDTSLDNDDPYTLAKQVRSRSGAAVIMMMASRYNPYDANRGRDAGADDFIDKPFDTQAFIDKMKKALGAREAGKGAPVAAAAAPVAAAPPPAAHPAPALGGSPRPPLVSPNAPRPAINVQRSHTLSFEGSSPMPPPVAPPHGPPAHAPAPPPVIAAPPLSRTAPSGMPAFQPPPAPAPVAPPSRAAEAAPVAAAVNGHLASKLGDLGLSPAQVEAVLALSREVVERVVWEVVPQLAETIIKEEIARLTKE